jgi:hypothetical protein
MKFYARIVTCIFFFLIIALPTFGQTMNLPNITKYFAVGFQQDGRSIPIENHQVILKKKTFTIVLYFKQPDSVLMNASFSPDSFEQARAGMPLKDIPGFSDLGMAEEVFNPKTLLMISTNAPHYWYYENDANHRFNDVMRKNGILICRRIVAQVMYRDTTRKLATVKDMREDELYLVFMKTEWTNDFRQQFEKQREYVKVIFR